MSEASTATGALVEVRAADVHGGGVVFCPNPKQALWSEHPRVFINVASHGEGKCPYCGTTYRLAVGETLHAGH
jgi:uncharacterized Zn-finger protein